MLHRIFACAAAAALLFAHPAWAHHPTAVSGAGGAGPVNTISASTLEPGQSAFSATYELIRFGLLERCRPDSGRRPVWHPRAQHPHDPLSYAYGVTKDFTISARLPYIARSGIREAELEDPLDPPEFVNRGSSSGIGDLSLLGQYRFFNNQATRTEAAVLFGIKAPTGVTDRINDQGERFDAEFQPGSGSWDGLLGLA